MQTKWKTLASLMVGLSLMLLLAACGGETSNNATPTPTAAGQQSGATPTQGSSEPTPTPTPSFNAEEYFRGQTISILLGFNPGGGTDTQARLFAQNWGKYFPGSPRFEVVNLPPDVQARNTLQDSAPDGLTIYLSASSGVTTQFLDPVARFDMEQLRMIGSHTGSSSVLFATREVPYPTMREAMGGTEPLQIDQSEPDSGGAMRLAALSEWLNIPMRFVPSPGGGTSTSLLMLERGDTNAYLPGGGGTVWYSMPFLRPGWLAEGFVRPFAKMGPSDLDVGPNAEVEMPAEVPFATDLLTDPQHKDAYETFTNADARYAKVFMAPPGMQDEIVQVFRDSYEQLLADPAFNEELTRIMGEPATLTPGAEVEQQIRDMTASFRRQADQFQQWIEWARERM